MALTIIPKAEQAYGAFNGGQIVENKPIGFPQDGGKITPYSNLFYWAYAEARIDSTIGLHPHQGFEIMSFVLRGTIRHYDTQLKEWRTLEEGDAQIIRAGNGISHAEHLNQNAAIFQIWVDPNLEKTLQQAASYDDYKADEFPVEKKQGLSIKTYIGPGSPLRLDTEGMTIAEWHLSTNQTHVHTLEEGYVYSIYVLEGEAQLNGKSIQPNDFVIIESIDQMVLESTTALRLFIITSVQTPDYLTYAFRMRKRGR
ncbi:MAG: pirin family protein [Bacteroidota bacterium]